MNIDMSTVTVKEEVIDDEKPSSIDFMNLFEPSCQLQFINDYDQKCDVKIKLEPEEEISQSSLGFRIKFEDDDSLTLNSNNNNVKEIEEKQGIPYRVLLMHRKVQCKLCGRTFINNFGLLKHNVEHLRIPISIEIGNFLYKNANKYDRMRLKKLRHCQHCDQVFKDEVSRRLHTRNFHEQKFYCDLCRYTCKCMEKIRRHVIKAHLSKGNVKKLKCEYCELVFELESTVREHVEVIHPNGEYKCVLCEAVFKRKRNLRQHVTRVHASEKHTCQFCSSVFKNKRYLTVHIGKTHSDTQFPCGICGVVFHNKRNMMVHITRVHSEVEFKCDICSEVFKNKMYMWRHVQVNHIDYGVRFSCWCGRHFRTPYHLNSHKSRLHSCQNAMKM